MADIFAYTNPTYILAIIFVVEKVVRRLPKKAVQYKDIIAGALCVGAAAGVQYGSNISVDVVAASRGEPSTIGSVIMSGVAIWILTELGHEGRKRWLGDTELPFPQWNSEAGENPPLHGQN